MTRATGVGAVAIGANTTRGAQATAADAIAIGGQATASSTGALALGQNAAATGINAVASGAGSSAGGSASYAAGNLASAAGAGSIAVGQNARANNASGIAIGQSATANNDSALALGNGALASNNNSMAIGAGANAINGSIALGAGATAASPVTTASGTVAGVNYAYAGGTPVATVSVGNGSQTRTITNVAAGRISTTSTDAINGSQLNATNQALDGVNTGLTTLGNQFTALAGDTSVANVNANGRGIRYARTNETGLTQTDAFARGVGSTAVGYNAGTATGAASALALGNTANANGINSVAIGTGATAAQAGAVALGAGSVTAAAVTTSSISLLGTTYNFAGGTPVSTVSVGSAGNARTITNVAAGRIGAASTDAINGSQLHATNQAVTAVNQNLDGIDDKVDALGGSTAAGLGGTSSYNPVTGAVTTGLSVDGTAHTNVQSALNQVNAAATAGFNITDADDNAANIGPNGVVTFTGDQNITVAQLGEDNDGEVSVTLNRDLDLDSLAIGDTLVDGTGVTVDDGAGNVSSLLATGTTVTDGTSTTTVGAGTVSVSNGTDTSTIGATQIVAGGANPVTINGATGTINGLANTTFDPANVVSGQAATEDQLAQVNELATAGFDITDADGNAANIGPNGVVTFTGDQNITVAQLGEDNDGEVSVTLNRDLDLDSLAIGDTLVDGTGVTVDDGAGNVSSLLATGTTVTDGTSTTTVGAGTVSVSNGTDTSTIGATQIVAGGANPVTINGGTGTINGLTNTTFDPANPVSGQAATEDQLSQVSDVANAGWNVSAQGANGTNVAVNSPTGNDVDLNNADGNIVITKADDSNDITFDLADALTLESLVVGDNTTIDGTGVTVDDGAGNVSSLLATGTTVTDGTSTTTVGAGTVSVSNGTDTSTIGATQIVAGGANPVTVNGAAGTINGLTNTTFDPANVVSGQAATEDQLAQVNELATAGFDITDADGNAANIGPNGVVTFTGDQNITVAQLGEDNDGEVSVTLNRDLDLDSLAIGDTLVDETGVAVGDDVKLGSTGLVIDGGPSITTGGIDAGGLVISDVAAGVAGTDAVNVDQLNATAETNRTKYYSVNDNGVQGGNFDNDGATGINAVASGVGSTATGARSYAAGHNATAVRQNGIAIGSSALAAGDNAIVIGSNAGTGSSGASSQVAIGNLAGQNVTGSNNVALGQQSGQQVNGFNNSAIGSRSGTGVTGSRNVVNGWESGRSVTGNNNIATGAQAGNNVAGQNNQASGYYSGTGVQGDRNVASGYAAGANVAGGGNVAMGDGAGTLTTVISGPGAQPIVLSGTTLAVSDTVALGRSAVSTANGGVAIGAAARADQDGAIALGQGSVTDEAVATTEVVLNGTTYGFAGTTPTSTVSVGSVGNERTITNVAAGRLSATSTDAVNGSQLNATNTAVNEVAGLVNAGFDVTDADGNAANIGPNGQVTFTGDGNITVAQLGEDNDGEVSVTLNRELDLDGLTIGETVIDETGVAVGDDVKLGSTGLVIDGGPSITTGGIDAGGLVISDVAAGVAGTDAVNVDQLNATAETNRTKYYSVNDNGVQGGNFDNDGATGINAVASGVGSQASGVRSYAAGSDADSAGDRSIAIGNRTRALATGAIAVGELAIANGQFSVAQGVRATASSTGAVAVGVNATANAVHSLALGSNTQALHNNSVALGTNSVTDAAVATTGITLDDVDYVFAGSAPTSTVSVGSVGNERTITNVAAGRLAATSTDAINGSQLNATNTALDQVAGVANAGWNVSAEGANATNVGVNSPTGNSVDFNSADGNIVVTKADDSNDVSFDLADDLDIAGSITVGNTVIDENGLAITGGPSITTGGIDAGGLVIGNVETGVAGTDAVNVNQLNATAEATRTKFYSVGSTDATAANYDNDGATGVDALAAGVGAVASGAESTSVGVRNTADGDFSTAVGNFNFVEGEGSTAVGLANFVLGAGANALGAGNFIPGNASTAIGNSNTVAASDSYAIGNNNQLADAEGRYLFANGEGNVVDGSDNFGVVLSGGLNTVEGDGNEYIQLIGAENEVVGAQNASVSLLGRGNTVAGDGNDLVSVIGNQNSVAGGGNSRVNVMGNGIDIDGATLTSVIGDNVTVQDASLTNVIGSQIAVQGGQRNFVAGVDLDVVDAQSSVLISDGGTVGAGLAGVVLIGQGGTVGADGAVAIGTGANASQAGAVALGAGSVTDAAVATAGTTLNGVAYTFAGTAPTSTVSVGSVGNERTITNVAAGRIDATSTDAVNGSQLNATNTALDQVAGVANAGWNVSAEGANATNVGVNSPTGNSVDFNNTDGNIVVTKADDSNDVTFDLADDLAVESLVVGGNTSIDGTGVTVDDGAGNVSSLLATGTTVTNGTSTTNVGAGTVSVSDGTFTSTIGATQIVAGGANPVTVNGAAGTVNGLTNTTFDPANVVSGQAATEDQLKSVSDVANAGWNVSAQGENATNVGINSPTGNNVDLRNADGNIVITKADDSNDVTFDLADALTLESLVVGGNTTIDGTGVAVGNDVKLGSTGLVIEGGPSITTGGIDAGGLVVGNVAAGVLDTDAVNVGQLAETAETNRTKYYSVNSTGGGNFDNEGATGADAIAAGKDAEAEGDEAVAMGLAASAAGVGSVAIGSGAQATMQDSLAFGAGAVAGHANSIALGAGSATTVGAQASYQGAYVGQSSSTGELNVGGRQVTGVAAGSAATDAVNVSQLQGGVTTAIDTANAYTDTQIGGVNTRIDEIDGRVTSIEGDIVDIRGDITDIQGDIVDITGDITDLDDRVTSVEGDIAGINVTVDQFDQRITDVETGASGAFQVNQDGTVVSPVASGTNASAGGNGAVASGANALAVGNQSTASGANSTAVGTGATASAANSTALGQGATASHANSVALGSGSATTVGAQGNYNAAFVGGSSSTGEVNVGGRTITGVAPGIAGTDAVNVNQLSAGVNQAITTSNLYTDGRINEIQGDLWTMERGYRGATASAMAMAGIPQAYLPGKSMIAVGFGGYQSEYGMAVGLSGITENGRYVYKAQASGNTSRDWGFSVGAGLQW